MNVLIDLDGSVQSQGIKVVAADWLDIGSETWKKTPESVKAAAYQAALVTGWKDEGLIKIITDCWNERYDEDSAKLVIDILREYAKKYPVEIEEVYKTEED